MCVRAARGEHMYAVTHLGDLTEHHRTAALDQQVGRVTRARVGSQAAERIAAAALHPNEQLGQGQLLAPPLIELFQLGFRHVQDRLHHGIMALPVL